MLVWVYVRLTRRKEAATRTEYGAVWENDAKAVPAFLPRLRRRSSAANAITGDNAHG